MCCGQRLAEANCWLAWTSGVAHAVGRLGPAGPKRDPEPLGVGATGQERLLMGSLCSRPWLSTPGL